MSLETWADRADYQGARAATMRCPCCGKGRTADSIVRVAGVEPDVRERAAARLWLDANAEYICTASLETLKREGLATRDELPRRER